VKIFDDCDWKWRTESLVEALHQTGKPPPDAGRSQVWAFQVISPNRHSHDFPDDQEKLEVNGAESESVWLWRKSRKY
jgi:hypothetical protein